MTQVGSRGGHLVEIRRDLVKEMVLSDHRPADNYVDVAIDNFDIDGKDGFVATFYFIKKC